jgi:aromatic ring-opening dioxygenase catalytic subunit (LigB family)
MASVVVGALGVPHNPNFPELVAREGAGNDTAQSYAKAAEALTTLHPDVIVIFTTDHLNTFFFENLPLLAIGVGNDFAGPNDEVPTVERATVPSHAALGRHLYTSLIAADFDLSLVQEFEVDHSVIVPLHFLRQRIPVIPIFVSTHQTIRPSAHRCFALGEAVRAAVEAFPVSLRVVVIGSGSFSFDVHGHLSPAGRAAGVPDPAWTEEVHGLLKRNAIAELIDKATPERFSRAGNVSGELLNWIAMLGATGRAKLDWTRSEVRFGNCYAAWSAK